MLPLEGNHDLLPSTIPDKNLDSISPGSITSDKSEDSNVESPIQAIITSASREVEEAINNIKTATAFRESIAGNIIETSLITKSLLNLPILSDRFAIDAIKLFHQNSQSIAQAINAINTVKSPIFTSNIFSQLPVIQVKFDFTSILEAINKQLIPIRNIVESFAESCSKSLRLINFDLYKFITDPLWDDIIEARQGDAAAAGRIAGRINWSPSGWQRKAIQLKARIAGKSPKEVCKEALTQGLLLVLGSNEDDQFPVLVESESKWVRDDDRSLVTICPGNLSMNTFWQWIKEEATRAAGLWLIGHPYATAFVVEEPPSDIWDIQLVKFTSSSSENILLEISKGRPLGSGIFENRKEFLNQVILVVEHVKNRGDKVTQERVAAVLSEKGLLGVEDPERQLRRWTEGFGFLSWRDLITHVKQLMSG